MSQEPVKIAILVSDGMVEVLTAGVPVEYVIVDYDIDGEEGDYDVPVFDGQVALDRTEEANLGKHDAEVNGPFVLALHDLGPATPEPFNEAGLNLALERYDHALIDYDETVKEIEALGWTERRATVILDEHINC